MSSFREQLPLPWNTEEREQDAAEILARYWNPRHSDAENIRTISWWLRQARRNAASNARHDSTPGNQSRLRTRDTAATQPS